MPLFIWDNKYSVNNNQLDDQHKTLFDIFNRLYASCMVPDNTHCIDPIIDELISFTRYHFTAEEQFMKDIGYKEISKHILKHKGIKQKILEIKRVAYIDQTQAKRELIVYLGDWVLHHVIEEDKKYSI